MSEQDWDPTDDQFDLWAANERKAAEISALSSSLTSLEAENEQLWAMFKLIDNDSVMVNSFITDPDATTPIAFNIICNDTFDWATADAETISLSDAPMLLKLWQEGGDDALMRWVQDKRGGPDSSPFIRPIQEHHNRLQAIEAELAAARQELAESQRAKCPICGEDKATAEIGKKLGFRPDIMALELKRLKQELAEAKKDSKRLDWLEQEDPMLWQVSDPDGWNPTSLIGDPEYPTLRLAIDAVRAAEGDDR